MSHIPVSQALYIVGPSPHYLVLGHLSFLFCKMGLSRPRKIENVNTALFFTQQMCARCQGYKSRQGRNGLKKQSPRSLQSISGESPKTEEKAVAKEVIAKVLEEANRM